MGVRDIKAWNSALLSKLVWDIHRKKDSLWIHWVHQYYIKHQPFWDWMPRKRDSVLMKKVGEIKKSVVWPSFITGGSGLKEGGRRGRTTSLGRKGCLSRGLEWCGTPLLRRNIASLCGWLLEVDSTHSIVLGLCMIWIRCVGYAMSVKNR